MERALGYIIGAAVAVLIVTTFGVLFGSLVIGTLSAIVAFPIAAPITTLSMAVVIVVGYLTYYRKRRARNP
jgi:uncharacterized protein YacL